MPTRLLEFAAERQRRHETLTTPAERKGKGHFGTPSVIAEFMAGLFTDIPRGTIRILDPGAGVGTLTAAICDRLADFPSPRAIRLEAWENDPALTTALSETLHECRRVLQRRGHRLEYEIRTDDFVLAHARKTLFTGDVAPRFDLAILNPPYFKLRKDSEHARVMAHVVHGQPNIYALFLAVATDLLCDGGQMVAITPRSYFNGPYFRRFRHWFLQRMSPRQIHLFESRKEVFRDEDVLQENVILRARKTLVRSDVILSTSPGKDPTRDLNQTVVPYSAVVAESSNDWIMRVTADEDERELVRILDELPFRLNHFGMEVSTGSVVSFRSTEFLLPERTDASAPLLWLHNVRPFRVRIQRPNGKPTHIRICEDSRRILLPARRFVLLKRFSAKEEQRRLVAGVFQSTDSYSPYVGLENHLNYIHRPKGELSQEEAYGLAALLNSTWIDRYFRAISGNTQVNAAEIRKLPLPAHETVCRIGRLAQDCNPQESDAVDAIVAQAIELPSHLAKALCGSAP